MRARVCICVFWWDDGGLLTASVTPLGTSDPYAKAGQRSVGGLETCSHMVRDWIRDKKLSPRNVLQVTPLKSVSKRALMHQLLSTHHRRLSKEDEAELGALGESSLVLFLSLCLRFMCWVKPATDGLPLQVPRSLMPLLDTIQEHLAGHHGEAMVEWTLGFLCAAYPLGLTDMELMDLVSTCDQVLLEQQDTGYTPPQKRASRRQWAALKSDLLAIGLIHQVKCQYGAAWTVSHVALEAMVRERLVHEDTLVACLKALAALYSGKLVETMGGRMVMACVCEHILGPSLVQAPMSPKGAKSPAAVSDDSVTGVEASAPRCSVMQPGGGVNRRRLQMLPETLVKLAEHTGGAWADTLTSLLTDDSFVELTCTAGLAEELCAQVADAMHTISRLTGNKSAINGYLQRLAALIAHSAFLCGSATFGGGKGGHVSSLKPSEERVGDDTAAGAAAEGARSQGEVMELTKEQVTERLMEWELERFTTLCVALKTKVRGKVRDAQTATLGKTPDIASIPNLRLARSAELLAGDAEVNAGVEPAWTAHGVIEEECLSAAAPCYLAGPAVHSPAEAKETRSPAATSAGALAAAGTRSRLTTFLRDHLAALGQTQAVLMARAQRVTDKADADAWVATTDAQLTRLRRDADSVTRLLQDLVSLEDGVAERSLPDAAMVHLRWRVHQHASRAALERFLAELRWLGVSRKKAIFARVQAQERACAAQEAATHDQHDGLVHWESWLTAFVGSSYTTIGTMSLNDHDLDGELEDLRQEAGLQELINADDGYQFSAAVAELLHHVVETTGTDFPRKEHGVRAGVRSGTFRKSLPSSSVVLPVYAQYDEVLEAAQDQLTALTTSGDEGKVGGSKAKIDHDLRDLFEPVSQQRLSYVSVCLRKLVEEHLAKLTEQLKDPIKMRAVRAAHPLHRVTVDLSPDRLTSLYSLRIVAMRRARRRLLGVLNVFAVLQRQMGLWCALLDTEAQQPAAGAERAGGDTDIRERVLGELLATQHGLTIDAEGVIHARDGDGELVVYDQAFNDIFQLEARVLVAATLMVKAAEREGIPDKSKVLHDFMQCELALHEAKLRLALVLVEVLEHSVAVAERRRVVQSVVDAMRVQVPVHFGSAFITSAYQLQVSVLNAQADLLTGLVGHQTRQERSYLSHIYAQVPSHNADLPGFPLPCVHPLHVAGTLANPRACFRLFPEPPMPPPPPLVHQDTEDPDALVERDHPPPPHHAADTSDSDGFNGKTAEASGQDPFELAADSAAANAPTQPAASALSGENASRTQAENAAEGEHDPRGPGLPSLCQTHARSEVLVSVGAAVQVLDDVRRVGRALAGSFVSPDAGIVHLAFHLSVLEEAAELLARHERREAGGASAAGEVAVGAQDEEEEGEKMVLVHPLHMSPMDNPLALDIVLQSLREQEKPRADGLLGLLRCLEMIRLRWLCADVLWETAVVVRASRALASDYGLAAPPPLGTRQPGDHAPADPEEEEAAAAVHFRLGHFVDRVPLPTALMRVVGLKEQELDIDFQRVAGLSKLLQDPALPRSNSGDASAKLAHMLGLCVLRKHMLAVALEYNNAHLDALLALHHARAQAGDVLVADESSVVDSHWAIALDGSIAPPPKKAGPKLLRGGTVAATQPDGTHRGVEAAGEPEARSSSSAGADGNRPNDVQQPRQKPVHMRAGAPPAAGTLWKSARPMGLEAPVWPAIRVLPVYSARLVEGQVITPMRVHMCVPTHMWVGVKAMNVTYT